MVLMEAMTACTANISATQKEPIEQTSLRRFGYASSFWSLQDHCSQLDVDANIISAAARRGNHYAHGGRLAKQGAPHKILRPALGAEKPSQVSEPASVAAMSEQGEPAQRPSW